MSGMGMDCSSTVERPKGLPGELEVLHGDIDNLANLTATLQERLAGLLSPEPVAPSGPEKEPRVTGELVGAVLGAQDKVNEMSGSIATLLSRLEV